jgi:hypothetical protein
VGYAGGTLLRMTHGRECRDCGMKRVPSKATQQERASFHKDTMLCRPELGSSRFEEHPVWDPEMGARKEIRASASR